jgi:hypothetical protein
VSVEGVKFRRSLPAFITAHIRSRKGNLTLPQSTLKIDAVSQGGCPRRAPDDSHKLQGPNATPASSRNSVSRNLHGQLARCCYAIHALAC